MTKSSNGSGDQGTVSGRIGRFSGAKRFRNEARVLSRLNHPAIQTIYDFGEVEGHELLISELVPGMSLDTRLPGGPLPEQEVVRLGVQLAQGLSAAHAEGVLHRDLKPSNLRVTPDGRLKMLDFGLATLSLEAAASVSKTRESIASRASGIAGTLPYMSPEQLLGDAIDERSDIHSAGVVLFESATGQMPFREPLAPKLMIAIVNFPPPPPSSFAPHLSPELDRIILKCLDKDAELRYQSAKELAADLRRLEAASARVATMATAPRVQPLTKWRLIGSACAFVAIVAAIAWWHANTRRKRRCRRCAGNRSLISTIWAHRSSPFPHDGQ